MAKVTDQIAIVVGAQVAEGTVNADVQAATIVANDDDGAGLSANEALGILIRDESLALDFERIEEPGEDFTGTFSKSVGSFLRSSVSEFSFDVTVKGGGLALDGTPSAGDYNLPDAFVALFSSFGLTQGTPGTGDTPYAFSGTAPFLTFKVWRGAISYTLQDCKVSKVEYKFTPGEVAVATFTVACGSIILDSSDTFPTSVDYGVQEDTVAPVLKAAAASIGAVTRGYLEGTLTLEPAIDEFPDSNAPEGIVNEQTGRTVSWAGNFYVDSSDTDQDYQNLIRTGSFEDFQFTLGVHVVTGVANALQFTMRNMNFTKVGVVEQAGRIVYALEGYATADGAGNDEFLLSSK